MSDLPCECGLRMADKCDCGEGVDRTPRLRRRKRQEAEILETEMEIQAAIDRKGRGLIS